MIDYSNRRGQIYNALKLNIKILLASVQYCQSWKRKITTILKNEKVTFGIEVYKAYTFTKAA